MTTGTKPKYRIITAYRVFHVHNGMEVPSGVYTSRGSIPDDVLGDGIVKEVFGISQSDGTITLLGDTLTLTK